MDEYILNFFGRILEGGGEEFFLLARIYTPETTYTYYISTKLKG